MNDTVWQKFERQVADLFRLRGYFVTPNATFAGRQHDLVLTTGDDLQLPILVECKHHDTGKTVGVTELEDFAARVLRLRTSGDVSAGFLVTNTGFSGPAKGALCGRPEAKFVHLRTLQELQQKLVNFEPHLLAGVAEYERDQKNATYEPLKGRLRSSTDQLRVPAVDVVGSILDFVSGSTGVLFVLTGDYGTGKTTVLKEVAYRLSKTRVLTGAGRIPVYIPLKLYQQTGGAAALLRQFLEGGPFGQCNVNSLLSMHTAGQMVLVLDGFDEMLRRATGDTRRETIRDLLELCAPNTKVILAGRPGYFSDDEEIQELFRAVSVSGVGDLMRTLTTRTPDDERSVAWKHYQLVPLLGGQVRSYLLRKAPGDSLSERENHVRNVEQAIASTYNLADLAKRPILLDMMSATLADGQHQIANTPADLYSTYVDTWLKIDSSKGAFRSLVSPNDRLMFSIALAWLLHDRAEPELHWAQLQELVGTYFRLEEADDVDHFSADVRTCTFLRRERTGRMSFAHLSFQEYFCARFILEDHRKLLPRFDELLNEPDLTVSELSEKSIAVLDFVGDLLACPVSPKFWLRVRALLAQQPTRIPIVEKAEEGVGKGSLQMMLRMVEGDAHVLELRDMADAYRSVYRSLKERVTGMLVAAPSDGWLQELEALLVRGRITKPSRRKPISAR